LNITDQPPGRPTIVTHFQERARTISFARPIRRAASCGGVWSPALPCKRYLPYICRVGARKTCPLFLALGSIAGTSLRE
jgi:hypothetical protein